MKLKENTWVYSRPNKWSHNVGQVHIDKFINVTGSTHYYLRVKLKNGKVGYISPETVELVRPMDRTFFLTSNSPVYDRPNRWGRKLSEVHKNHAVHVVGIALEYMKIRMKDGLEGFIPRVALDKQQPRVARAAHSPPSQSNSHAQRCDVADALRRGWHDLAAFRSGSQGLAPHDFASRRQQSFAKARRQTANDYLLRI